jgi:hypothetical protein
MNEDIKRYRDNLRDELNGAALYAALAAAEADPLRKDLFLQLSQAEASHAQLWREKLAAAGINDERFVPGFRTRLLAKLARRILALLRAAHVKPACAIRWTGFLPFVRA